MHRIELNLASLPDNLRAFVEAEVDDCTEHGFAVRMINKAYVECGLMKTNGYFDDNKRELAVAVDRPLNQWIDTFVHESCHKDQCVQKARIWGQQVRGCDPFAVIEMWLNEVVELKPLPKYQMTMAMLKLELDCEKRAVKKIKKAKLPIDTKEYAQKANSYVYFYHMVAETRKWYTIGTEPYVVPEVWQAMPTDFKNDYTQIPKQLRDLYLKHCYNGKQRR